MMLALLIKKANVGSRLATGLLSFDQQIQMSPLERLHVLACQRILFKPEKRVSRAFHLE